MNLRLEMAPEFRTLVRVYPCIYFNGRVRPLELLSYHGPCSSF